MKIPFNFGFASLIRLYFPGLFWSAITFPVFSELFKKIKFLEIFSKPEYIALEAIFWGIIIYVLDDTIYQILEGRILWPSFLFKWGVKRENGYIKKLLNLNEKLKNEQKIGSNTYNELWYKLRVFPINGDIEYKAVYPTRLGNIIQGYELYPKSRYGLDAIFYWYRIWLKLDKNIKEEIDNVSAKADFAVYSSFLFYVSFIFNLVACGIGYLQTKNFLFLLPLPSCQILLIISGISLLLGYIFYKLSCPLHRFYGEYFKSIFDLNKNSILEIGEWFGENERKRIKEVWRYLQYLKIKCPSPECGELNSGYAEKCEKCGVELPKIFKEVKDANHSGMSIKK